MKRVLKILFLLVICLWMPKLSLAWEQTMTCVEGVDCDGLKPFPAHWANACIGFHIHDKGSAQLSFDTIQASVRLSILAWQHTTISDLSPYLSGLTNEDRVGYNPYIDDNANIIVFRDGDTWQESRLMMALTTVTHRNTTGVIYDADIELNTSDYIYGTVETDGANVVDLQNTLTHEIGHVFGLAHSDVFEATMFPYASMGEIGLRTLHADDLEAISTIYPPNLKTQCKPEYYYFEKPPYAMNEAPVDNHCQAMVLKQNTLNSIVWLVLFGITVVFCIIFRYYRSRRMTE